MLLLHATKSAYRSCFPTDPLAIDAEALTEALDRGRSEVFNTDQGSQFTSQEFTQVLQDRGVKISMDGKGRYADNIFVERLWRTVKY